MIRVTVELDKWGQGREIKKLGELEICNLGTGTPTRGNYGARAIAKGSRRVTRKGVVLNHARKSEPIWKLVRRALEAMNY